MKARTMIVARKSVSQSFSPSKEVSSMMESFRQMVNDCIRIGLANDDHPSRKRLSTLCYHELDRY